MLHKIVQKYQPKNAKNFFEAQIGLFWQTKTNILGMLEPFKLSYTSFLCKKE